MQAAQWIIAAVTAVFVAVVAYLQWRTAQQKAVLDLFEQRHAIYEIVRKAVSTMASNSNEFDQRRETEFMQAMERAYFFFGDDVGHYLAQLWSAILIVRDVDKELPHIKDPVTRGAALEKRRASMNLVTQFHSNGKPVFARYMRFLQRVPITLRKLLG
jgi:hypothetical protein